MSKESYTNLNTQKSRVRNRRTDSESFRSPGLAPSGSRCSHISSCYSSILCTSRSLHTTGECGSDSDGSCQWSRIQRLDWSTGSDPAPRQAVTVWWPAGCVPTNFKFHNSSCLFTTPVRNNEPPRRFAKPGWEESSTALPVPLDYRKHTHTKNTPSNRRIKLERQRLLVDRTACCRRKWQRQWGSPITVSARSRLGPSAQRGTTTERSASAASGVPVRRHGPLTRS